MRTRDKEIMKRLVAILGVGVATLVSSPPLTAESAQRFGVEAGVAYTPDDSFHDLGWNIAVLLECAGDRYWALRSTLGGTFLQADVDGDHPHARYGYATFGVATQDLVSFVGGIGLYYVSIEKPLVDTAVSQLEPGVNGGVFLSVPYRHSHFITAGLAAHRVFTEGPDFFVTLTGGFIF
jgi:hypothetical protein